MVETFSRRLKDAARLVEMAVANQPVLVGANAAVVPICEKTAAVTFCVVPSVAT